jgi:endonuclease/exonuclease/phosphatase family metal-dependent hydrolase
MALTFISVNIERSRHIDKIIPLLQTEKADVVCLQEVMASDLQQLASSHQYFSFFSPTTFHQRIDKGVEGIAILSRYPFFNLYTQQYAGPEDKLPLYDKSTTESLHQSRRYLLQIVEIEVDSQRYCIANTHFTWSANGQADDYQRQDLQKMMHYLKQYQPLILAGDFNAPRGREIFSAIAQEYQDNIPADYETSLDKNLHRAGYLPYMVDGLFSSPEYQIAEVELIFGVSDHAAVKAKIGRLS